MILELNTCDGTALVDVNAGIVKFELSVTLAGEAVMSTTQADTVEVGPGKKTVSLDENVAVPMGKLV